MNLQLDTLITLTGGILTIGISYAIVKTKVETVYDEIRKVKEWKENQNGICQNHLIAQERLNGDIKSQKGVHDEQFKEIIRRLDNIEKIIDRRHSEE